MGFFSKAGKERRESKARTPSLLREHTELKRSGAQAVTPRQCARCESLGLFLTACLWLHCVSARFSAASPPAQKRVEAWRPEETARWLGSVALQRYAANFQTVNGKVRSASAQTPPEVYPSAAPQHCARLALHCQSPIGLQAEHEHRRPPCSQALLALTVADVYERVPSKSDADACLVALQVLHRREARARPLSGAAPTHSSLALRLHAARREGAHWARG